MRVIKKSDINKGKSTYKVVEELPPSEMRGARGPRVFLTRSTATVSHPREEVEPNPEETGQMFRHIPAQYESIKTSTSPFSEMDEAVFNFTTDAVSKDFPNVTVGEGYSRKATHPAMREAIVTDQQERMDPDIGEMLPEPPRPLLKLSRPQFSQHMLPGLVPPIEVPKTGDGDSGLGFFDNGDFV